MGSVLRGWLVGIVTLTTCCAVRGADVDRNLPPKGSPVGNLIKRFSFPDENERSHVSVRKAFREVVASASHVTVRVLSEDLQASLGVVVHPDGYILTKAS